MVLMIIKNANLALAFFLELGSWLRWGIGVSRLDREQSPGSDSALALQWWLWWCGACLERRKQCGH